MDILRHHGEAYLRDHAGHVGRTERRIMRAITACRTSALGGHVEACDDCGATRIAYNSCRGRHCPSVRARRERNGWRIERANCCRSTLRLKPDESIRRFLLHVLPPPIFRRRIRHFGFLANGHRTQKACSLSLAPVERGRADGAMERKNRQRPTRTKASASISRYAPNAAGP